MDFLPYPFTSADRLTVRHFRKSLPKPLRADFDASVEAVMMAERSFSTDQVTQGHLIIGACVVSAHRIWMRHHLDPESAKAKVAVPMRSLWKRSLRIMMRMLSFFSKDEFEALRRYTKERGARAFGPSFKIEYLETDEGFVSEVHRCGYSSFLMRHDATLLLDLFCEWDRIWIDALSRKVSFHRPPTQAHGGRTCRFEFRRGS
ncbi:MAG: L-2-amino-thiazoline-4-carboxylic acid hydrolase [Pseudomonadota bacterium]